MQRKIGDRAVGSWKEILFSLGVPSGLLTGKHVACPVCGGKDRFRFDDKGGKGTWFCAQQHGTQQDNASGSSGNGFGLIMDLKVIGFAEAARLVETVIGAASAPQEQSPKIYPRHEHEETYAAVRAVWKSAKSIVTGDLADQYLRKRVGSYVPTRALRFHPALTRNGQPCAALVSAFVDVYGDLAGLQRGFLTQYGDKVPGAAPRMTMGSLPMGGAVRLARHERALGIAEGVETALAATALFGVPCWSALNAGRLEGWEPPDGVTEVVIFGDNDLNGVGQAAAYALGKRLNQRAITHLMIPTDPDTDWNDVLAAKMRGEP